MRLTVYALALVLTLAGCSQNGPAQQPQPDKAPAPAAAPHVSVPAAQPAQRAAAAASENSAVAAASPALRDAALDAPERDAVREPQVRELEIPAGTTMSVRLATSVASDSSHVEDAVRGRLISGITVEGATAVPAGSEVIGTVRDAQRSGRVKGRASIAFQFERLTVRGEALAIRSSTVTREAAPDRGDDVKKAAIGGAAGAIVGGLFKGGKGAIIGAGVGGTGAVLATRGDEVRLAAGTVVRMTLRQALMVRVRSSQ